MWRDRVYICATCRTPFKLSVEQQQERLRTGVPMQKCPECAPVSTAAPQVVEQKNA